MIVLTAPPGYGKTMLAAEWTERVERVAWYAATPASADLAAFSLGLAEEIGRVVPGAGARLRQRLRVEESPEDAARPVAELLAEDLAAWPEDAWLVVDDYHLLAASPAAEDFVGALVELSPVRLLVATRRRPSWATARRVLYGEVTELTRDHLAMTDEEAQAVLEEHGGEAVHALVERAQGWPAVIGLAALSGSVAVPSGDVSSALFRYFAEEVLRQEPPDLRQLMLGASVVRTIGETLPAEVLGPAGREGLARLAEDGLLHEASGGTYRFHPLLREFLLHKLEREEPERAAAVRRAVLEHARGAGRLEEAFEVAVEADWLEVAAEVTAEAAPSLLDAGRVETVARWLSLCGGAALRDPALVLARGEVAIRSGRVSEAGAIAHELAAALPAGHELASRAWHLAGRADHLLADEERALRCHLAARDAATDEQDLARALWGAVVSAAQLETETLDALVTQMEEAASGQVEARIQLASGHAFLASRRGTLAGLWSRFEPLVEVAPHTSDPMVRASFFIGAAYVNLSRADYGLALELIGRALATCDEFRLGDVKRGFCLCYRAGAEIGLRRFVEAERTLAELARGGAEHALSLASELRILRLKLALAKGDPAAALALADGGSGEAEAPASAGELAGLVALAAAAAGDRERSAAQAERAREVTASIEAHYHARFASVVSAAAAGAERAPQQAADLVATAAGAEILDPFVVAYRAYPPLLGLLADDPFSADVLRRVLPAANDGALARRTGVLADVPALDGGLRGRLGLLTPREREVLELVADGLGNAEIARRLFISEKTAKVHVHHIFEKLGVASRLQAALVAKEILGGDAER